jgi:hypothetical protein
MIPYTYKVTHILTGQWYYGVRYANNCHPDDLWVNYFTSSSYIRDLINVDGKDAFKAEVRRTFKTKQDAIKWELKVLKKVFKWLNCLNHGAFPAISQEARSHGNITKAKIQEDGLTIFQQAGKKWKERQHEIDSITGLTRKELRKQRFNASLDKNGSRKKMSEITSKRMSQNNPSKNPETAAKISETLKRKIASGEITTTRGQKFQSISDMLLGNEFTKNTIWVNDGICDRRLKQGESIPEGFNLGRLNVKNKGHKYQILTCPYCTHEGGGGNMKRYHFENCKHRHSL